MKKLIISFIIIVASKCTLYSQNRTIKGRVISDDFQTVALASIIINDTFQVGKTDLNGFFQIDIPALEKNILFKSVGLESVLIKLSDTCYETEVVMILSGTYDFMTLKKADKFRMKRFKKLPELHSEAFAKGIFKTGKACYTQEFIPHYKKK